MEPTRGTPCEGVVMPLQGTGGADRQYLEQDIGPRETAYFLEDGQVLATRGGVLPTAAWSPLASRSAARRTRRRPAITR